ncbi:hypothetical protein ABEB36_002375 [Hypothenemus hampei]|uniref:Uncharacterized protein n=1 Tax=Hypothenemus hampei TaxID=57062 RepID=A0ABD1F5X6_HYPHA
MMKFKNLNILFIVTFHAVQHLARSDGIHFVEIEDVRNAWIFINCLRQALDGGLPAADLPNYNPLKLEDFTYSPSADNTKYILTNNTVSNSLNYGFKTLSAIDYHEPERVAYNYSIIWNQMAMSGNVEINSDPNNPTSNEKGSYDIQFYGLEGMGIFNLTKSGQEDKGFKQHLDDFTVSSLISHVQVTILGLSENEVFEQALTLTITTILNNFPQNWTQYLKEDVFNDFWINHHERIDEVYKFCQSYYYN